MDPFQIFCIKDWRIYYDESAEEAGRLRPVPDHDPVPGRLRQRTDDTSSGESGGEPVKYLIGISQYGQHGSLDNCREGFLQGLEQAGLVEGTDFEVDYQNANFDDNHGYPDRPDASPPRTRT